MILNGWTFLETNKNMKYEAKIIDKIDNGKGCWNSIKVGIFENEKQIGEYKRNYPSLYDTFFPFEKNGKWYALYSPDYTVTRIISLPDCKDIGGEEPDSFGFCPTEFLVPKLCGQILNPEELMPKSPSAKEWAAEVKTEHGTMYYWPDSKDHPNPDPKRKEEYLSARKLFEKQFNEWQERNPFIEKYADWGFVAGCIWGDDSSWKIELLDLSQVDKGILKREDRFGYIELPRNCSLKNAINTDFIDVLNEKPDKIHIRIAQDKIFSLDGKEIKEEL